MIRDMHEKREANVDNPEMSKCRNRFWTFVGNFQKTGFRQPPGPYRQNRIRNFEKLCCG